MINEPITDWKELRGKCVICSKEINKKKENYVNLRDFNKGKFESECFYHLKCWQNRFQITQEKIHKSAEDWMNKISNLDVSKLNLSGKAYRTI
jgi:hypothetical protein